eukprot:1188447-Prorocentrum_minimum.AAC.6
MASHPMTNPPNDPHPYPLHRIVHVVTFILTEEAGRCAQSGAPGGRGGHKRAGGGRPSGERPRHTGGGGRHAGEAGPRLRAGTHDGRGAACGEGRGGVRGGALRGGHRCGTCHTAHPAGPAGVISSSHCMHAPLDPMLVPL